MAAFGKGLSGHQHYAKVSPPQPLVEAAVASPVAMREVGQNDVYIWTTASPMTTMAPGLVVLIMEKQQASESSLETA